MSFLGNKSRGVAPAWVFFETKFSISGAMPRKPRWTPARLLDNKPRYFVWISLTLRGYSLTNEGARVPLTPTWYTIATLFSLIIFLFVTGSLFLSSLISLCSPFIFSFFFFLIPFGNRTTICVLLRGCFISCVVPFNDPLPTPSHWFSTQPLYCPYNSFPVWGMFFFIFLFVLATVWAWYGNFSHGSSFS